MAPSCTQPYKICTIGGLFIFNRPRVPRSPAPALADGWAGVRRRSVLMRRQHARGPRPATRVLKRLGEGSDPCPPSCCLSGGGWLPDAPHTVVSILPCPSPPHPAAGTLPPLQVPFPGAGSILSVPSASLVSFLSP